MIRAVCTVPIIEIYWNGELFVEPAKGDNIVPHIQPLDFGRDLLHPGIKMNQFWADKIIEKVRQLPDK